MRAARKLKKKRRPKDESSNDGGSSAGTKELVFPSPAGTLNMRVSDDELARRRAGHVPQHKTYGRSFAALYQQHVTQANEGCDFDFLQAGEAVPEPPIH